MARFDPKALDGADPLYMPCTSSAKQFFYWRAPPRYVRLGYMKDGIKLVGQEEDGRDLERAAQARDLTREMLRWFNRDAPLIDPGTWNWLIGRYLHDDVSPFQDVKANTKQDYRESARYWEGAIGKARIDAADFATIKKIEVGMRANGRSSAFIARKFTFLRILASYGSALDPGGPASKVKAILGEMRFKAPKARTVAPTRAHVEAIIAKADAAGETSFALGMSLQWWLALRAVDVRGQWLPGSGGITRGAKRWQDGMTWDMIDRDITVLRKTPSKTEEDLPDELVFDLTLLPEIRARLQAIPQEQRVGPVIKDRHGMPYDRFAWSKLFRRFREAAGVPSDVWMMDTRAGAINDAKRAGASLEDRQRMANHASLDTTERYNRGHDEVRNKVIKLRREQ
jgi:integrase